MDIAGLTTVIDTSITRSNFFHPLVKLKDIVDNHPPKNDCQMISS